MGSSRVSLNITWFTHLSEVVERDDTGRTTWFALTWSLRRPSSRNSPPYRHRHLVCVESFFYFSKITISDLPAYNSSSTVNRQEASWLSCGVAAGFDPYSRTDAASTRHYRAPLWDVFDTFPIFVSLFINTRFLETYFDALDADFLEWVNRTRAPRQFVFTHLSHQFCQCGCLLIVELLNQQMYETFK